MDYVSELLQEYPPTMSARLLAYLLTANSGRPEGEYKCLKQSPQLTMRTNVWCEKGLGDTAAEYGSLPRRAELVRAGGSGRRH